MFDKLVESTKGKQRGRSGRFLFLTGLIYALLLTVLAVWTIMGFSPGLAEGIDWARLAPPIPLTQLPPAIQHTPRVPNRATPAPAFRQPTGDTKIPEPATLLPLQPSDTRLARVGLPISGEGSRDSDNYTPGG